MTRRRGLGLFAAAALALGGCATTGGDAAAPTPGKPTAPSAAVPDPLVARHRQQAEALERDGQLRRAAEEWKIVLTIRPEDAASRESLRGLQARIAQQVAERIEEGRRALTRGVQVEARRKFLSALALDPGNRVAFDLLQSDTREVEFITHTVRAGDTLTALAQRYYGDRSRAEVIWETNQLPPNPRLAPGSTLKIPEIPGVPFVHPEARKPPVVAAVPTPDVPRPAAPAAPEPAAPGGPAREEPTLEVNPLLTEAREALDRSDYVDALGTVDKYLAGKPGDREGLTLKKQALYGQAKSQIEANQYPESFQTLTQLARLQPDYEDTPALLKQARTRMIEQHYTQGVRFYREEKLKEAIAEWRVVLELDPNHANARRNIDQAEKLLRGLEQRMKK